jgi:phosphodiesterase/alkaline phosphatase D-like protein
LDGQADATDPKQEIDVTWSKVTDSKAPGRIPTGTGSGVDHYNLYYATTGTSSPSNDPASLSWNAIGGNISASSAICSTDNNTKCTYPHSRLEGVTYYYYKLTATDVVGHVSTISVIQGTVSGSNSLPNTPTQVSVSSAKGNPNSDGNVGHKVNLKFVGGKISDDPNRVVGYEIYRTTNTNKIVNGNPVPLTASDWLNPNYATLVQTISGLNVPHDTIDPGDTNCPSVTLPYGQGTVHFRCYSDTVPTDATTYYYKIRTVAINATPNEHTVYSVLSAIGNDIVPDATAPMLPTEVKIKDIHGDGLNYLRNIISWARIDTPYRNGVNDFREYRIYKSLDGVVWTQIKKDVDDDGDQENPLYDPDQEKALAINYYIDPIPVGEADHMYYYYVTAVDNADTEFKYADNTPVNGYANESAPVRSDSGRISSVSLNPAIAQPSIVAQPSGLYGTVVATGVSSATISWTTNQDCDSLVEFRKAGSTDKYRAIGDRGMVTDHSIDLWGLTPLTSYEYRIISRNFLANEAIAESNTLPPLTTSGFTITHNQATQVKTTTSSTEIWWSTNLDAKSAFVEYQLQRQPGDEPQSGGASVTKENITAHPRDHMVVIKGLRSNRTYTYKIKAISTDDYLTEYPIEAFGSFKTRNFDSDQFTIAPNSSNVAERNINATTAQIVWETSVPATSWVDYGTKSGVYDYSAGNDDLVSTHVVKLEGLTPGTRYYYRVRVKDANEVEYTSAESSFVAVLKPKIENMRIKDVKPYEVTISWETNVETETVINWGKTASYGDKKGSQGMSKAHEVHVTGLEDNSEYHFQIIAHDEAGNEVADSDKVVTTPLDTEGPQILGVKTDILPIGADEATATVIVSWQTNKPASTLVEYDEGILGGKYTKQSIEDKSLNTSHTVIIKDLKPASSYHYKIVSKDKRGNVGSSPDHTFVTPSKEKSILQLILKSLEETFAWTRNIGKFFGNIWGRMKGV